MRIGSLIIRLAVETGVLKSGLSVAEKEVAKTTKAIQRRGQEIADFGKKMSIGLTTPLLALAGTSIKAAIESRDAIGQVDAALKSMGNGAGRTREQLEGLASGIMRKSLYDDDEILRSVTANMLTFGNVAGEQFERAQQAAVDLSARLGQDLQQSTVMVGKALNDPIQGLSALRRVGIQFTESQEAMIKKMAEAGDVAGAQKIMLGELEKQFGKSAEAARDADPMAAARMSFAEFQETIGEKLLPLLPVLTDAITRVLDAFTSMPEGMQEAVIIVGGLAAAFGPLLMVLGSVIQIAAPTIAVMKGMGLAFDFAGVLKNLIPMIGHFGKALLGLLANPIILGAAVLIGGIYLAWKNWDKIEPVLRNLYTAVKTWLLDKLGAIMDWVVDKVKKVENGFAWLYDKVVGNSWIPDLVDEVGQHMGRLQALMVDPAEKATQKTNEAFRALASDVSGLLDRLFPQVAKLRTMYAELGLIDRAEKAGLLSGELAQEARTRLRGEFRGTGRAEPDLLKNAPATIDLGKSMDKVLDDLNRKLGFTADKTKASTVRIAKSFKDMAEDTLGALRTMTDAIKGGGFLDILEGILGLGLQLGSIGLFGSKIAANINKPRAYARGTNWHPGGLAILGEEGPELVNLPRGSSVATNAETKALLGARGGNTYHFSGNLMTPEFWARVHAGDMAAANGGAQIAGQQAVFARSRRLG